RPDEDHYGYAKALAVAPVGSEKLRVVQPVVVEVDPEGHADAEHARPLEPASELLVTVRRLDVHAAHDAEASRVLCGRIEAGLVHLADPGRDNHRGAVAAGRVHFGKHLLGAPAAGAGRNLVASLAWRLRPRPLRPVDFPEMYLCVRNHGDLPRRGI